jgi:hypothetical protein
MGGLETRDWKREIGKQPTPRPEEGAEEPQDQEMEQVPGVDEEGDLRIRTPYYFDSFLSIERDLPQEDGEELAFAFYRRS